MTTVPRHLVEGERVGFHAGIEPKDAATLIIVDRTGTEPKVLLGRRHARHVFLPGKFVFPGGRVDAADSAMPAATSLHPNTERKLLANTRFQTGKDVLTLALAAIRETFEETGLVVGAKCTAKENVPAGWRRRSQGHCNGQKNIRSHLSAVALGSTPTKNCSKPL